MNANKLSPIGYALAALVLTPFALLALVFLFVLGLVYWPVLPVAVYFATKKHRQIYAKGPVNEEDPGFVPRKSPHPVETCACDICKARRQELNWPEPAGVAHA